MSRFDTSKPLYPNFVTDRQAANYDGVIEVNTLYGALWGYPDDSTAYFDALLKGIQHQKAESGVLQLDLDIARIEFVYRTHYDKGLTLQGAILFDRQGQAILHFGHALLGYEGSGPSHSRDILRLLGLPAGIFGDINNEIARDVGRDKKYVVVVQKHTDAFWEAIRIL